MVQQQSSYLADLGDNRPEPVIELLLATALRHEVLGRPLPLLLTLSSPVPPAAHRRAGWSPAGGAPPPSHARRTAPIGRSSLPHVDLAISTPRPVPPRRAPRHHNGSGTGKAREGCAGGEEDCGSAGLEWEWGSGGGNRVRERGGMEDGKRRGGEADRGWRSADARG
jgi:hypothetical protein